MACLIAILLLGFIWSLPAASGSPASQLAKAALVPSTAIGTYSRSSTVAALSLLEQEKLEEATESLVQTALTLSLLDVGGGAILPITEEIVTYITTKTEFAATRDAIAYYNRILKSEISKSATQGMNKQAIRNAKEALKNTLNDDVAKFSPASKVKKAFTKVTKWFGKASVFDVLGPLTDTLTIGLNIWGLDIAIRDGNDAGIAAASLSILAGVVGLGTFFAAVATGSAVLGPIGAIAGAILGIAATLIELFVGPPYDKAAVEAYRARLRELRNLRDACVSQIDKRMEFLENVGSPYSDVYVNNQASTMTEVERGDLQLVDSYMMKYHRGNVPYQNSMYHRGFKGHFTRYMLSEAKEEMRNKTYVCIGRYRGIVSPYMPLASSSTGWGKTTGFVGFDFYGKYKRDTTYGGAHVFVNSEFISEEELNGFNIDTYLSLKSDADQLQTPQNDVISISEYKKLRRKRAKINIRTGFGSDCLNINGMIGEFHQDYENILTANMEWHGWNILSFKGMSRDRNDIKGVFFDIKHEVLKYFHGEDKRTHTLGKVFFVTQFVGSPFDDHVILHQESFKVFQTSGSNVYEFDFDEFDLGKPFSKTFEITDQSKQPLKINLKTLDASKIPPNNIVLSYKKLRIYSARGSYTHVPRIEVSLWNTTTNGNIFINDDNPIPLDHAYLHPWRFNGERKNLNIGQSSRTVNYDDGNREDVLLLKWSTDQDPDSTDYTINMKGGKDYVMISDKYLLDPSGIDGEDVTLMLERGPDFNSTGAFTVVIQKNSNDGFRINLELRNVERMINEYGNRLVAFDVGNHQFPMDLFDRYMEVTRRTLKIKTTEDVLD